jgi:hypothetical protein
MCMCIHVYTYMNILQKVFVVVSLATQHASITNINVVGSTPLL